MNVSCLMTGEVWCLFGVYYERAPARRQGIKETKEKSSKCIGDNHLRTNSVLTIFRRSLDIESPLRQIKSASLISSIVYRGCRT